MYNLVMKLLKLSQQFPDGFTLVLPDGSLLKIEWLFGDLIEEIPRGIKIRQAFGIQLSGDFGETIITVYVTGS
jgi:hypothetical protein